MSAAFRNPLRVEKIGPHRWLLIDELIFYSEDLHGLLVAPRGFQTDFASIPRFFWTLFPPVDVYDPAAVMHDAAYASALHTFGGDRMYLGKELADKLFREALKVCGVSGFKAWLMYRAVSMFGDHHGHPLAANRWALADAPAILEAS